MSYASLIFKDSPEVVWALNEPSGNTIFTDGYVSGEDYNGQYLEDKYTRSPVPITYGGKVAVYNSGSYDDVYSTSPHMFRIPSISKFTSATKSLSYTLEFWANINFDQTLLPIGAFESIGFLDRNIDGGFYATQIFANETDGGIPTSEYDNLADGGGITVLDATSRLGETPILKFSGNSDTGVYIKDLDYLVFKLGDIGKQHYESVVHVSDFNKPLHIACIYTPTSIKIVVNGKSGNTVEITDDPFNTVTSRDMFFCMPNKISGASEHFYGINFDTVAIYNVALNEEVLKRHYVYGLGYSVTKSTIKGHSGTMYDSHLQNTPPLRRIDYSLQQTWSGRVQYANTEFRNSILSTKSFDSPKFYISSIGQELSYKDMIKTQLLGETKAWDYVSFPANSYSYLEIERYESITGGNSKQVAAKFRAEPNRPESNQQLLYVGSRTSSSALSFEIEGRTVIAKIIKNGTDFVTPMEYDLDVSSSDFSVSYAVNGNTLQISILDEAGDGNIWDIDNVGIFPLQDGYLRFGSKPIFFGNENPINLSYSQVGRFTGQLKQIDIGYFTTAVQSWDEYPEKNNGDIYQVNFNKDFNKCDISTKGSFGTRISLIELVGPDNIGVRANAIKMPIKIDVGSTSADITFNCGVRGQGNYVTTGNIRNFHLPVIESNPLAEDVYFDIVGTVFTTDTITAPGQIEYLRIYTYPFEKDTENKTYIKVKNNSANNDVRYYNGNKPFKSLCDFNKTTDLYRSYNTGYPVGASSATSSDLLDEKTPYLRVPYYGAAITANSSSKIYGVMFTGIIKEEGYTNSSLLKIGNLEIMSNSIFDNEDALVYVNKELQDEETGYNKFVWNHFFVKFPDGIVIESLKNIDFGFSGSAWHVDNIVVFENLLSESQISNIYDRYFSENITKVYSGNETLRTVLINDSEKSDGRYIYQPLNNQMSFFPYFVNVASTTNIPIEVSGSNATLTIGTNLDNFKIDQIDISDRSNPTGIYILLKNQLLNEQNGLYDVVSVVWRGNAPVYVSMTKINTTDGQVFFVRNGKSNRNTYFKKEGNNYSVTPVQKKVVSWTGSMVPINSASYSVVTSF
jgi:hypothetical protein